MRVSMDWTGEAFIDLKINCVCGQPITAHFPVMDAQITCDACSKTYKVSTYCAITSERDAQEANI